MHDIVSNPYFWAVTLLLVADYALNSVVDALNARRMSAEVPREFEGWYDPERYAVAQRYLRETTRFGLVERTCFTLVLLVLIVAGGFGWVDTLARSAGWSMIPTGLLFAGICLAGSKLIHLPFDLYDTFVIEERYGFNRTTPTTFLLDLVKGLFLAIVIGGAIFALVIWLFANAGPWGWVWAWLGLTVIQVFLQLVAPVVLLPLFNTFTPLPEGELKQAIERYAAREGFRLTGVFTVDGSRRSSKANAYFTGFGRWRRIALFDTLIEKHGARELLAVLAHEVGHYKLRHIHKAMAFGVAASGLMLFVLSLFISRADLYHAFGLSVEPVFGQPPLYAGLVLFGFLYAPVNLILSVLQYAASRRHEFQADAFAVESSGEPEALAEALKKLSVDQLSNLTPHPWKVVLDYSHPPVLERIRRIERLAAGRGGLVRA